MLERLWRWFEKKNENVLDDDLGTVRIVGNDAERVWRGMVEDVMKRNANLKALLLNALDDSEDVLNSLATCPWEGVDSWRYKQQQAKIDRINAALADD